MQVGMDQTVGATNEAMMEPQVPVPQPQAAPEEELTLPPPVETDFYAKRGVAQKKQEEDAEFESLLNSFGEEPAPGETAPKDPELEQINKVIEENSKAPSVGVEIRSPKDIKVAIAKGLGKGVLTAVEQAANLGIDAADAIENILAENGIGSGQLIDGSSRIDIMSKMFDKPANAVEASAKFMGQYLAPFSLVSKFTKANGIVGAIKQVSLSAGITSAITDPNEERLSNLIQANPALANPISAFLAHNEKDDRFTSRIKTGIEAATVDVAALGLYKMGEAIFKGVQTTKAIRKAKELQKVANADPVPVGGEVIDEKTLAAGEQKISQAIDDQVAQASKEAAADTAEGAAAKPKVSQADVRAEIDPKPPKPEIPEEEIAALRKAESIGSPYEYTPMDVAQPTEGKVFYHGTKAPIKSILDAKPEQFSSVKNLYGTGLYLTDNPNVASSYAAGKGKGAGGRVLEASLNDLKLIDLEQAGGQQMADVFNAQLSAFGDDIKVSAKMRGKEMYDLLKEEMTNAGYTDSQALEMFADISAKLHDAGFDGLRYEGGNMLGKKLGKHNVAVLFGGEMDGALKNKVKEVVRPPLKAKTMPELLTEIKETGRKMTAEDLHEVAKRGVVSDKENLKLAKKIVEKEGAIDELFSRKFGDALSQEKRDALKLEAMKHQLELQNSLGAVDNIDDLTHAELAAYHERLTQMDAFYASADAATSEAGRALRTAQKFPGLLETGDDYFKAMRIKEYIKMNGGIQDITETLKVVKKLMDEGLDPAAAAMYKNSSRMGEKLGAAAYEFWVNNVLSSPNTWVVTNPFANIFQTVSGIFETGTAEIYGKLLGNGVVSGETMAYIGGLVDGFSEGLAGAKKFWKGDVPSSFTKFTVNANRSISAKAFGVDPATTVGMWLDGFGNRINLPTKALSTQDVFFNIMLQRARINQISHRMAIQGRLTPGTQAYADRVARLRKTPSANMIQEAERYGQELTLTTPLGANGNAIGKSLADLQKGLEKIPFGIGKYAGAFMRVGYNLADRAVQRTPLTFLRAETRANLRSLNTTKAQEEMAKMTLGTGVTFGGVLLASNGLITGTGPDDPKMRKALKSSGWQERSIRLPGGGWMKLDQLGPMGVVLGMAADVAELAGRIDNDDLERRHFVDELIIATSTIITDFVTPEFLQQGVPDLFSLIKDTAQGRRSADDYAESLSRFSTGFIPYSAAVKDLGKMADPARSDTRPSDVHASSINKLWQRVRNEWLDAVGLDGYAGLPPELNVFGEEVFSPLGVGSSAKSAIFSNNRDPNDPVVKELIRLNSTGAIVHIEAPNEEALSIRMPERVKRKGIGMGQGRTVPIQLTPEQYHDYVKLVAGHRVGDMKVPGGTLKESWKGLMESDTYKSMSDDEKKIAIKEIYSRNKTAAWELMMQAQDIREEFNARREDRVKNRLFNRGVN